MHSNSHRLWGNHPMGMRWTTSSPKHPKPTNHFRLAGASMWLQCLWQAAFLPTQLHRWQPTEQGEEEEADESLGNSGPLKTPYQVTVV